MHHPNVHVDEYVHEPLDDEMRGDDITWHEMRGDDITWHDMK